MGKDKVVIAVTTITVISAIIFGILMAYRTYKQPLVVYDIEETVDMLKNSFYEDEETRMINLSIYNELARSCKMKNKLTGEIREFSKEEMNEIYNMIGGKEKILEYLRNIEDKNEKMNQLEYAYSLKIITSDELSELWDQ